ncbi:MAG: ATP-binding cassette domain-containing protein [Candidatus Omnitrophica bacterium]|nr:ATP-binding cassette domain-containing protein [Candidatus Omnitrophota bacterium]
MEKILEIKNIKKGFTVKDTFGLKERKIEALKDVSFNVYEGENFGIVGESGSGKTTLAKVILFLVKPDSGKIFFRNEELTGFSGKKISTYRRNTSIIFQNPYKSLNPRFTAGKTISEAIPEKNITEKKKRAEELLKLVGLDSSYYHRFPHQLSGGERQRIAIARAIAGQPLLIIADEPTANLDASIQGQIVNLLMDIKTELGITYIFISHDLKLIDYLCDRVAVIYKGRIVEIGTAQQISNNPFHPYTKILLNPDAEQIDIKENMEGSELVEIEPEHLVRKNSLPEKENVIQ